MPITSQSDHGYTHPQRLAGGWGAVIGIGVQGGIHLVVHPEMLGSRHRPAQQQTIGFDAGVVHHFSQLLPDRFRVQGD